MSTINDTRYISTYSDSEETLLAVILSITACLALYGNSGMLIVLYKNDKMWNSTNMLIGNLALSGVLVSLFCMPFNLTSIIIGKWPFKDGIICKFNAFNASVLLLATILTHTMISVDKYFYVVKPFSRAMTVSRTSKIIFLVWFIAALMSFGPLLNFGKYEYNHTTLVCGVGFPRMKADFIYLVLLATIGFVIPNLVMTHVYIKVFIAVRKHTKRLQNSAVCSLDVVTLQKKLILTVVFSLICFLACWTPFLVLCLMALTVETIHDFPYGLGIAAYWCGYLYNALNPLIICSMSQRFGEGLTALTMSLVYVPVKIVKLLMTLCCSSRSRSVALKSVDNSLSSDELAEFYVKIEHSDSPAMLIRASSSSMCEHSPINSYASLTKSTGSSKLVNDVCSIAKTAC